MRVPFSREEDIIMYGKSLNTWTLFWLFNGWYLVVANGIDDAVKNSFTNSLSHHLIVLRVWRAGGSCDILWCRLGRGKLIAELGKARHLFWSEGIASGSLGAENFFKLPLNHIEEFCLCLTCGWKRFYTRNWNFPSPVSAGKANWWTWKIILSRFRSLSCHISTARFFLTLSTEELLN